MRLWRLDETEGPYRIRLVAERIRFLVLQLLYFLAGKNLNPKMTKRRARELIRTSNTLVMFKLPL